MPQPLVVVLRHWKAVAVLAVTAAAADVAAQFVRAHAMPEKAAVDALHVAIAVVNGMDYVLTWELHAYRECRDSRQTRTDVP